MKLFKLLGLTMVGALVAIAFVGASSASATVLCKENKSPCGNAWPEESTIVATSAKAVLLGTLSVECASEVVVLTEKNLTGEITGKITKLTWTGCTGGCSAAETTTLPSGKLTPTSGGNGTLLTTSEAVVVLKNCGPFKNITCTAKANDVPLAFTGGAIGTANAVANEAPVKLSGGLGTCGENGKWDAGSTGSSPYVIKSVNGATTGSIFVI